MIFSIFFCEDSYKLNLPNNVRSSASESFNTCDFFCSLKSFENVILNWWCIPSSKGYQRFCYTHEHDTSMITNRKIAMSLVQLLRVHTSSHYVNIRRKSSNQHTLYCLAPRRNIRSRSHEGEIRTRDGRKTEVWNYCCFGRVFSKKYLKPLKGFALNFVTDSFGSRFL